MVSFYKFMRLLTLTIDNYHSVDPSDAHMSHEACAFKTHGFKPLTL